MNAVPIPSISTVCSTIEEHWFTYGDSCISVMEVRPRPGREAGNRPGVFFLHGRLECRDSWSAIGERLGGQFRSLSLDLPGFGRSFTLKEKGLSLLEHAALVLELMERYFPPPQRVVLVGHDVGGGIAQLCAIRAPHRLKGMVLINSSCLNENIRPLGAGRFRWTMGRRLVRLLAESLPLSEMQRLLIQSPCRKSRTWKPLKRALQSFTETWPGQFERQHWREELQKLECPALILWGRKDQVNPCAHGESLMQLFREAYLFEDADCGHWPNMEKPEWVVAKMQEFIFRLGPEKTEFSLDQRSLSR